MDKKGFEIISHIPTEQNDTDMSQLPNIIKGKFIFKFITYYNN